MKTLIVYGTTEGQTRKITRFIEAELRQAGHAVTTADATEKAPAPDDFDAVLIGASVHVGKYQSAVVHYAMRHAAVLNALPSAFFAVSMAVASDDEAELREAEKITADFMEQTGWEPTMTTQIAGALLYTQYDFFKRWIIKMIAKKKGQTTDTSEDHEYTDWEAVKEFVKEFNTVASRKVSAGVMVNS